MAVSKIWVFAEADGDKPTTATLELLTKAREFGGTLEAVHVGANPDALAAGLGEHGATTVYAVDPGDALPLHGTFIGSASDPLGMEVQVSVTPVPLRL